MVPPPLLTLSYPFFLRNHILDWRVYAWFLMGSCQSRTLVLTFHDESLLSKIHSGLRRIDKYSAVMR